MLSIIICSKNRTLTDELTQNLESTVGIPFECIVIDNSTRNLSIFTAYNEGIKRSTFPFLCFVHEDVVFKTQDWGKNLCEHLSVPSVGVIGLCGGLYQGRIPASWGLFEKTLYIIQSDKKHKRFIFEQSDGYDERHEKQVVTLDGVFLAGKRTLFEQLSFDNTTFDGFHAYDHDICLQSHITGHKNIAVNDILLVHYSKGRHDENWVRNMLLFVDKWKDHLPIGLNDYPIEWVAQRETIYMRKPFLKNLVRSGYSNNDCKYLLMKYMSHDRSFIEWVESPEFNRWLFAMRLKKKPSSLFKHLVSQIVSDASSIV